MRVSSHWRMKQQLYRLKGTRYNTGTPSLVNRQNPYHIPHIHISRQTVETVSEQDDKN